MTPSRMGVVVQMLVMLAREISVEADVWTVVGTLSGCPHPTPLILTAAIALWFVSFPRSLLHLFASTLAAYARPV